MQINFILLISRQGKTRLTKWYNQYTTKEKGRVVREVTAMVLGRPAKQCNFIEWREDKVVYKRLAPLRKNPTLMLMVLLFADMRAFSSWHQYQRTITS